MRFVGIGLCVCLSGACGMSCVRGCESVNGNADRPTEAMGVLYYTDFASLFEREIYEKDIVGRVWNYRATITSCDENCKRLTRLLMNGSGEKCHFYPGSARLVIHSKVLGGVVVDEFGCTNDGREVGVEELSAALDAFLASREVFLEISDEFMWPPEELRKPLRERRQGPFDWVPPRRIDASTSMITR